MIDETAAIAELIAAGDDRGAFEQLRVRLGWPHGKDIPPTDLPRWLSLLAELAVQRLTELGYVALAYTSSRTALQALFDAPTRVDLVLTDELLERGLGQDRNPFRIQRPGELGRILAPVDVRNLRRSERDDLALGPVPVDEVEVVKVASGSAGDQHPCPGHA